MARITTKMETIPLTTMMVREARPILLQMVGCLGSWIEFSVVVMVLGLGLSEGGSRRGVDYGRRCKGE